MVEQNEETPDRSANQERTDELGTSDKAAEPETTPTETAAEEPAEGNDDEVVSGDAEVSGEDESEIAADYLEELLDIADLDGDIDIEVRQNRAYISVVTEENEEDLELLVGRRGEVLDALQELVRLSVLASTGQRSRLILDVAGYRDRRGDELKTMAEDAIASVKDSGNACHLKPLSPYERKIVHDIVAENGLHSESEGEGSKRHIVISVEATRDDVVEGDA